MNVSHPPGERPPEATGPRFEEFPVLTAYTALDSGEHVIDGFNRQFRDRLDRPVSALLGRPLRDLYDAGGVPGAADPGGDDRGAAQFDGGDSVPVGSPATADSPRSDPAGDAGDDRPWGCAERDLVAADGHLVHTLVEVTPREVGDGYAVYHVDVTRRRHREKQAAALNRLLRHNIRNDLNLLRGYARTLRDHDDDEVVAAGTVIDRIADRWLGLAESGREIEQVSATQSWRTVRLDDLLAAVRTAVERSHSRGVVDVEFDGVDPVTPVSEQWYAAVVELCENGIKHADPDGSDGRPDGSTDAATPPCVTVTIRTGERAGWVVVAVADEGPGIPPDERRTLKGEAETPLQHGSGLGTWLVRFVVEQFGGQVSVDDREGGGSVVALRLPTPEAVRSGGREPRAESRAGDGRRPDG